MSKVTNISSLPFTLQSGNPEEYPIAYGDNVWDEVNPNGPLSTVLSSGKTSATQHEINEWLASNAGSHFVDEQNDTLVIGTRAEYEEFLQAEEENNNEPEEPAMGEDVYVVPGEHGSLDDDPFALE